MGKFELQRLAWLRYGPAWFLTFATVGLGAIWLGHEWAYTAARLRVAKQIEQAGGEVLVYPHATHPNLSIREMGRAILFGDLPVCWIQMPKQTFCAQDEALVRSLYPHPQVDRYTMHPTLKRRWRNFEKP
jgi:hypothetical protein